MSNCFQIYEFKKVLWLLNIIIKHILDQKTSKKRNFTFRSVMIKDIFKFFYSKSDFFRYLEYQKDVVTRDSLEAELIAVKKDESFAKTITQLKNGLEKKRSPLYLDQSVDRAIIDKSSL